MLFDCNYLFIFFRRQFDNIKRVFKVVEEMPGAIVENIKNAFQLSDDLAKKYACVVFIACIRFDTSKKKLQHISFNSWKACSEIIMEQWTYNISGKTIILSQILIITKNRWNKNNKIYTIFKLLTNFLNNILEKLMILWAPYTYISRDAYLIVGGNEKYLNVFTRVIRILQNEKYYTEI